MSFFVDQVPMANAKIDVEQVKLTINSKDIKFFVVEQKVMVRDMRKSLVFANHVLWALWQVVASLSALFLNLNKKNYPIPILRYWVAQYRN